MLEEQFEAIEELQVIVMVCIRGTYECGRVCLHLRYYKCYRTLQTFMKVEPLENKFL